MVLRAGFQAAAKRFSLSWATKRGLGKHFNLAGKGGRDGRGVCTGRSGAAAERQDKNGPLRLRVDQKVAVGDGDAAVGPVGEVPRVEVELH